MTGCTERDGADVVRSRESALVADDELRFIDRTYATFIAGASDQTYAPLRETTGASEPGTIKSSYYRLTCSLALVGAVYARQHAALPSPMVEAWIREAIIDYPNFALDDWGHHVRLAPAVDCLLAASVAQPFLEPADREALRGAALSVAPTVAGPNDFRAVGRSLPGNTQAEEAALSADFLYLASELAVPEGDARRQAWKDRAAALFHYAGSIPAAGKDYDGEPFRVLGSKGQPLGPDANVVTNHGLEASPYYSLGALISYADSTAVARALGEALPPGISLDRTTFRENADEPPRDQLGVREIFGGGLRRLDRATFGFTGAYRFVGEDGEADVALDYASQTQTIPQYLPGEEVLIPTKNVGTVSQFVDLDGSVKGYQIDGAELRAFECKDEPRGWFCRARFKSPLVDTWSGANVGEQHRFGGHAMPSSAVDAMPQWLDASGALHTEVFSGGRVWHYACAGTPRACHAVDSTDLAAHYARHGFAKDALPPTDGVDAATAFIHLDGTGRRYWVKGGQIWRARCDASFSNCSVSSETLANQFASLSSSPAFSPALPTDGVDAMTQFVRDGVLSTYVFRGDTLWKYDCTMTACTPRFTHPIAKQWRGITNQERWADRTLTTLHGVTDWGVQATMMNATFALASVLGVDDGVYPALVARQRDGLRLADQPLLPSTYTPSTGAFGYGIFDRAYPVMQYGTIQALEDGWSGHYASPGERLNTFTWMNGFAGRNHAVAYLLTSGSPLITKL